MTPVRAAAVAITLALAACTPEANELSRSRPTEPQTSFTMLLAGGDGLAAIEAPGGQTLFAEEGLVATPDGRTLFRATPTKGTTTITTVDPGTGAVVRQTQLDGRWRASVSSVDGMYLALVDPPRWDDLDPSPRSSTAIVVVDPADASDPRHFDLDGNYEPEAFSADGRRLFMIQHVPALIPSAYRVTYLDLRTGEVAAVRGGFDTPTERMAGSRLGQLWRPDGGQLFTLYSNQPTRYAERAGGIAPPHDGVTFVHVLDVREGWAYCVGLPGEMGDSQANDLAMATSADGSSLFVLDVRSGSVARMDTSTLQVPNTARVRGLGELAAITTSADGGSLFVAGATGVIRLDARTLRPSAQWGLGAPPSALGVSSDGLRLLAVTPGSVTLIDPIDGSVRGEIPLGATMDVERILAA